VKTKLTKIMGVALALVLVFSLGMAFMPSNTPGAAEEADAATLAWSGISIPSTVNSRLVGNNEDLGPVAVSPNFANDNTVFAAVNDPTLATRPTVFKSTNGGFSWVATTTNMGAVGRAIVDISVSPSYASDSSLFVATQDVAGGATTGRVWRSTNGNVSYGQLGVVGLGAGEVITSMDISPDYDGTGVIAVGVAAVGTATYAANANCVQVWGLGAVLSWTSWTPTNGSSAGVDVSAIKFSPSYPNDNTLLVVTSDAGTNAAGDMATTNPYLRAVVGGVWDSLVTPTLVNATGAVAVQADYSSFAAVAGNEILFADIAVGSDYNAQVPTSRQTYVTIVNGAGGGTELGNVYRITNVTNGVDITGSTTVQLANLDYSGDFSGGTLIGGLYGAAAATASNVYRTTNPTSSVVNWYGVAGAANMPTGTCGAAANTTAFAVMSPDFATDSTVLVGTQGAGSAFGASVDGAVSFNERGLIENAGANLAQLWDVALSPGYATDNTMFLISNNADASANDTNVWRTQNGGATWERCFTANFTTAGAGMIALSQEFASDSVGYIGDGSGTAAGGTAVWYTADGGTSWSARNVAAGLGITIGQIVAPDASTVYVGDFATGNVAKSTNSGWTWPGAQMSNSGTGRVVNLKVSGSTILVGGNAGDVRVSTDGGATYGLRAGAAISGGGNMYVAYDAADDIVYAADNGTAGQVYRSTANGSWVTLTMPVSAGAVYGTLLANELILAEDGTLYMGDPSVTAVAAGAAEGAWRSINPSAAEPTPGTTFQPMTALVTGDTHMALDVAPGSSNIVAILEDPAGGAYPGAIVPTILKVYTDTLSLSGVTPTLVGPADGTVLSGTATTVNARFVVEFPANVTQVTIWYSSSSSFANATAVNIAAPSTASTVNLVAFEGLTVYWMARASLPYNGPWTDAWTLEMPVVTAVQAPTPAYPAGDAVMNIALEPVLNWSSFRVASGYEVQLAKDSAMSDLLVDMTGANALGNITSYKVSTPLSYSTTYYWRVRALKGTSTTYSDWSAITGFTTIAEPVAPTPPVEITQPVTPVETETPAYIWAIIGIGAVLVIVVVVLIVRTRRAV